MTYTVVFDSAAEADLEEIAGWIAERANLDVATGYVGRLVAYAAGWTCFQNAGRRATIS
jgi:plasmid stabilization system protein ParE